MKAITTAIMGKFTGSALDIAVKGQLYHEEATDGATFPYIVHGLVSGSPTYPGGKVMEDILWEFSIFSSNSSAVEALDILALLRSLYDDCSLAITGETLVYFIRGNYTKIKEEITAPEGTSSVWHYTQEYLISTVV